LSGVKLSLIPLENCFIAASGHHFLLLRRDCGKNRFADERERIRKRHQIESEVLFPINRFVWSDQVDDESFELLIRELLVREKGVRRVRKVSPSQERDGGRDLIAEWNTPPIRGQQLDEDQSPYTFRRVIVQCKGSKATVGKSKVQDIGDTVEHYDAQGYFLCVSSWLSTTLTDHLEKRRSEGKFWVDWWTRYEIEERLGRYPDLANKYPGVVTVPNETT
jgi:Restriction endonuclease